MKKILVVSRNFPPLLGGMERLNLHLVDELSHSCVVHLVAPEGARDQAPAAISLTQVPLRPLSRFLAGAAWHTLREARRWKPDIVLAGSGLTAPIALIAARACGARTAAYVHGLDLTVPHPIYRALWRPTLRRLDTVIANSHATARLAEMIGIGTERTSIVHPGVSLPTLDPDARARFRQTHGLGDEPVLLSVGRLTARKGLQEFVTEVLPQVATRYPDVRLIVIGEPATQALFGAQQSPQSILAAARAAGVGERLRFLGRVSDTELADAYAGADLYVFPVRHFPYDPEGFGMVAVEAAAHGLATVAYATGGVVDAVSAGQNGSLAPAGDATEFSRHVIALLEHGLPPAQIRGFAEQFAWPQFGKKILAALEIQ
ncbi:glycoside hydrolase [Betaproteobacteria bacterium]|nr:glycoside hydrolase [Betaproteobacteria bacterium]GHU00810.1 glycoside hydrolase [Betaproteobacteria bacterium]GHU15842.1 glycoside hydrolase [Betaproteobacteria bacterium]